MPPSDEHLLSSGVKREGCHAAARLLARRAPGTSPCLPCLLVRHLPAGAAPGAPDHSCVPRLQTRLHEENDTQVICPLCLYGYILPDSPVVSGPWQLARGVARGVALFRRAQLPFAACPACQMNSGRAQEDGHITDYAALLPAEFYPNPFLSEPKDGSGPTRPGPCWEPIVNGYGPGQGRRNDSPEETLVNGCVCPHLPVPRLT